MPEEVEPLNILCCDGCGHTELTPLIEVMGEVSTEEMERFIQERFFAVKRAFAERGWFTSMGYDLCPACCKETGIPPGYRESTLLPETRFLPRWRE